MNKIRIQNAERKDLVVIDMDTGAVELLEHANNTVAEAAQIWWDAVTTIHVLMARKFGKAHQDVVMQAVGAVVVSGDIVLTPTPAPADEVGDGNVTIYAHVKVPEKKPVLQ